jgi:hypothetical protein
LHAILSEKNSSLTLGHRAFAGLVASGIIKAVNAPILVSIR